MLVKVKAQQRGYADGHAYEVGDIFMIDEKKIKDSRWIQRLEEKKEEKPKPPEVKSEVKAPLIPEIKKTDDKFNAVKVEDLKP